MTGQTNINPQSLVDAALGTEPVATPLAPLTQPEASVTPPTPPPTPSPTSVSMGDDTPLAFAMPAPSTTTPISPTPPTTTTEQSSYLPPVPPAPSMVPEPPKKKKKMGLVMGGILLMVMALAGGVWGLANVNTQTKNKVITTTETTEPSSSPETAQIVTIASVDAPGDCQKDAKNGDKNGETGDCVYDGGCVWDVCTKWEGAVGGTCVDWGETRYRQTGCGGGGDGDTGCPAGTILTCVNPRVIRCTFRGTCAGSFPSKIVGDYSCGNEKHVACQTNCTCNPIATAKPTMSCKALTSVPDVKTKAPAMGETVTFTCTGEVVPASAGTPSYKFRYNINSGTYATLANKTTTTTELTINACGSYSVECQACATLNGTLTCDPVWTGATTQ